MSEHRVTVAWERGDVEFTYQAYRRDHTWSFEGGINVGVSAAPAFKGNPDLVDPEEAFVASLSSCHLLTFLALAAKKRFVVDRYTDRAVGHVEKIEGGKLAVTRVELRPEIRFSGDPQPTADELADLHERAHDMCFIANSVKSEVTIGAGVVT